MSIQTRKSKESNYADNEIRNIKLDNFFTKIGMEVTLVGSADNPAIIFKNKYLACYVKNFRIIFLDKCDQGLQMYTCRVDDKPDPERLAEWYKTAKHNKAWRINVVGTPLFICGYSQDYPVFGKDKIHYYKNEEFAKELIEKYNLNYCEIV